MRDVDAGVNDTHLDRVGAGGDIPRAGGADLDHGSSDRGPAGVVGGGGGGLYLVVGLRSVACVGSRSHSRWSAAAECAAQHRTHNL